MVDISGAILRPLSLYLAERAAAAGNPDNTITGLEDDQVVRVYPTGRSSVLYPGVHFSLPAGYGAGTAAAINDALSGATVLGAGDVYLPPEAIVIDATIDHKYDRVMLGSAGGGGGIHSAPGASYGCKLVASFAGTVLKHRTPYAAETGGVPGPKHKGGGGFKNISVFGNSLATRLLEVDSVADGTYRLFLNGCVGTYAAHFTCGETAVDLAEACDIQNMAECYLSIRQLDTTAERNCGGVYWDCSVNANVSINRNIMFDIQHYNGHAFEAKSGDNNLINMRAFRPAGTGKAFIGRGPTASLPVGFEDNAFLSLTHNTTVEVEGTDTVGVTTGVQNRIYHLDTANGSAVPTAGTGSDWVTWTSDGRMFGNKMVKGLLIDSTSEAVMEAQLAAMTSETVRIYNASENHFRVTDGTNEYALRLASGVFTITPIAGVGKVNLGLMDSLHVTDGVTALGATAGRAKIYVDTADGDLKVVFADGTVKTIVVDT